MLPVVGKVSIIGTALHRHLQSAFELTQKVQKVKRSKSLVKGQTEKTVTKPSTLNKGYLGVYVVGSQALVSTLIPVIVLCFVGKAAALAALVGGWIAVLANLYFAIQAFRFSGARASQNMVRAFYRGEAGKFVIVMLLFIAAFKLLPGVRESAAYLFSAFFVVYGVAWLAPLFLRK
ncbi:MAG: ATP synthase subunit I [Ketobacter sp.]|uniref:ATP synthase subunit I n=1 Tax=unclassified Ketobacter TaxID=2639109 RepID=UPI0025C62F59|nr:MULTISPECIES: ATP synthase subunit I [unclassified Ketobacter]MEC8813178.1 ATP synthase subunit I [Pseudomonadota bacterium]